MMPKLLRTSMFVPTRSLVKYKKEGMISCGFSSSWGEGDDDGDERIVVRDG